MNSKFKTLINGANIIALSMCFSNCGGGSDNDSMSGKVVQGSVVGATVFADHLSGTQANRHLDTNEESTTTDANGDFIIATPNYDHVLISIGGTDSLTGRPAIQMLAPSGSTNISPLTTLVALSPDPVATQAMIQSLGVNYDTDISENISPAAALLIQSIEAAMAVTTNMFTTDATGMSTGLSSQIIGDIQRDIMTQIAASIQNLDVASLTNPATLASAIGSSVTNAINSSSTIESVATFTNPAAIAAEVNLAVTTVATDMLNTSGASTTETLPEAQIVTQSIIEQSNIAVQSATTTANTTSGIVVTPPANQDNTGSQGGTR